MIFIIEALLGYWLGLKWERTNKSNLIAKFYNNIPYLFFILVLPLAIIFDPFIWNIVNTNPFDNYVQALHHSLTINLFVILSFYMGLTVNFMDRLKGVK